MLNVDLSTLRGQELRQLLDTTRRRGDAAVTYEILQEMAVRRERGEPEQRRSLFGPKRPAEPRVIELNLGDPLDPKDPELGEAALAAPADWDLEAAENDDATYLHPPPEPEFDDRPPPQKPRRRALWLSTGLALGLVAGLALGGWAESVSQQPRAPLTLAALAAPPPTRTPAVAAPVADPIAVETETAPATPAAPLPGAITPIPAPPPSMASAPIPAAVPAAKPAPDTATAAPVEVAEETAPDTAKVPAKESVKAAVASADTKACAGQPTPADRIICGTPRLQRLQKDLREAYAGALEAHQDRDLLREHQLAWREARNTVTEPDRLARLYEERIRKLKAATAEALEGR